MNADLSEGLLYMRERERERERERAIFAQSTNCINMDDNNKRSNLTIY